MPQPKEFDINKSPILSNIVPMLAEWVSIGTYFGWLGWTYNTVL